MVFSQALETYRERLTVDHSLKDRSKVYREERFIHHDLRYLFATRCIESAVDIPTVSRWFGHKDGVALAMKTYGHLRHEHSLSMAKRVSFGSMENNGEPTNEDGNNATAQTANATSAVFSKNE